MTRSQHYSYRAEELRTLADDIKDEYCRGALLRCADEYMQMAERQVKHEEITPAR